jgi:Janus/Ocnus family (Ocnus)
MKIVYIDYSEKYYREFAGTNMPEQFIGKFVQVRNLLTEYFIFSPKEFTPYHTDIVERFCTEREIPGIYNKTDKSYEILDPEWVVVGGGKFAVDRQEKNIRLYDDSMAYGKFDKNGMKEKILSLEDFSGYEVQID